MISLGVRRPEREAKHPSLSLAHTYLFPLITSCCGQKLLYWTSKAQQAESLIERDHLGDLMTAGTVEHTSNESVREQSVKFGQGSAGL